MTAGEADRQQLGHQIRARRTELNLSISAAARTAGINRNTWSAVERGERATEDYIYGAVERTLDWPTGTITRILTGDQPEPTRDHAFDAVAAYLTHVANNPNRDRTLRAWAAAQLDQLNQIRAADLAAAREAGEAAAG